MGSTTSQLTILALKKETEHHQTSTAILTGKLDSEMI